MSVAALPQSLTKPGKGYRTWVIGGVLVVALAGVLYYVFTPAQVAGPVSASAQYYDVVPMDLEIKIAKDGEVQAINNIDINCQVEGSTMITWVVPEGTSVKKGDLLLTLDSTQIRQRMEDASLDLEKADADLTNAREQLEIQKSTNDTNLESAQVALSLAELDMKQYSEGTYPQELQNAETDVKMKQITLNNRKDDLAQTKALYAKDFVTGADVTKAELDVVTAQQDLDKAKTQLDVLTKYIHDVDLTAKQNTLQQARQKVNRTKAENLSNLKWRTADMLSKEQSLTVLKRRYDRLKEQYAACNVYAPADGMVIYGSTTDRNAQTPIQEGTQVRERQLLIRLPDVSAMKAVVRIQEQSVPKLKVGEAASVRIVGVPAPIPAKLEKISVLADNSNRWWNPDLREYPVDLYLDKTPVGLKPGMGVQAEILVDRIAGTLAVPLDAVYSVGGERYVFVPSGDRAVPTKVAVGANNETHIQILDGIKAGQRVLRLQAGQGRELLEKAGIKVEPTTRPSGRGKGNANGGGRPDKGGRS